MEIVIVVAIWTVMVKRGVEDIWHTARGGTPPRLAAAKARRSTGAAGRYWSALWDDVWTDLHRKHVAKRANPDRPRGAATVFWSNLWRDGWVSAERRRQQRTTRPRPGQETVPGVVVPNAQDEDRPQDGDRPDPQPVPDEDENEDETRDQDEDQQDDEPPSCPKCGTDMTTAPNIGDPMSYDGKGIYRCPSCDYKIRRSPNDLTQDEDGYEQYLGQRPPADPDEFIPVADMTEDQFARYQQNHPTQEGPTTMTTTIPTGEVVGLSDTIKFCEGSAEAFRAQVHATELTIAAVAAGGDTSPGAAKLSTAMELCTAAAAAMDEAAVEYKSQVGIQEQYNANPGAGDRDFILAGQ